MSDITIGTMSVERRTNINQPSSRVRLDKIFNVVQENDLDLLVCSGDFLDENHLSALSDRLEAIGSSTKVVLDIDGQTNKVKRTKSNISPIKYGQDLFLVEASQPPRLLAKQVLILSRQLWPPHSKQAQQVAMNLISQLEHRSFTVKGKVVSTMICGEINFYKRNKKTGRVTLFDPNLRAISKYYDDADIIVNPTHDRMACNRGTLEARRRFLSRQIDGRKRCYVSTSNWDIRKPKQDGSGYFKQTYKARGNQTVYVSRIDQTTKMKRLYDAADRILWSTITVSL